MLGPVVFHGYGQTETGMIAMATPAELLSDPAVLASVGRPPDGRSTVHPDARRAGRRRGRAVRPHPGAGRRLLGRPGRDRRGLRRRLGPHPRPGPPGRRTATCTCSAGSGTSSSSTPTWSTPARSSGSWPPTRPSPRRTSSAAPTTCTGEAVHAFVVPAAGPRPTPAGCATWSRRPWGRRGAADRPADHRGAVGRAASRTSARCRPSAHGWSANPAGRAVALRRVRSGPADRVALRG